MARTYSSSASEFFSEKNDTRTAVPELPSVGFVKVGDTPNEFIYKALTPLDQPCRVSIKYQDVGDIYTNAKYIENSARVANKKGIRISVSYTEVGAITDSDDATYMKLLPTTVTINLNQSVAAELTNEERINIIKRALGAFLACKPEDATDATQYEDCINRLYGSLTPSDLRV